MKLYEIDSAILDCFDMETGEVLDIEKLEALQIEREAKLENVALAIKNLASDAEQIKSEIAALKARLEKKEKQVEGYKYWLGLVLDGERFETAKCAVTFRKSERTVPDDGFCEWAREHDRESLITEKTTYQPDKAAIKAALLNGEEIPAKIETVYSMSVK